jgi:hypothetical protein
MAPLGVQITWLFILAIPVSCIAWTVTHEEIFSEFNSYCRKCSAEGKYLLKRKFFYLFTCEFCFSHYITVLALLMTKYTLLLPGWRGYIIAGFSLVWVANFYMSIYARIRVILKKERVESKIQEKELEELED